MANIDSVNLTRWADELLSALNLQFSSKKKKRSCLKELLAFMETNEFFGVQSEISSEGALFISRSDADRIRPNLELWLRSYGSDSDKKLKLQTERMVELFPDTGALFADFMASSPADSAFAWKLADYLCFALCDEINQMSDKKLNSLAADMDRELPLTSARLFSEFLMYIRRRGWLHDGWVYRFNTRRETEVDGAYATSDFLKMAYIIFNDEAWSKERLLEKALDSEPDANLWLYVSLHFICGWRSSDLVRLPMPKLPVSGAKIREQLAAGIFETGELIDELEFRLRYTPLEPQKTEIYENVPELKLFVPESLRKPMGIILAVAASHHEDTVSGGVFLRKAGYRYHLMSFFGESFTTACGGSGFSSRRANKAYLQGIEMMAETSAGQPKGYMLAALARSHKGGVGALPATTDVYLRDAKFAGYRPEFIAREMFERGVFSFIPALMLEMYARESYTELSIPMQTKALAEIGIHASGLEGLAKMVDIALVRARNAIAEIMRRPEDIRGTVAEILQNIASGDAPGKQDGCLCLMTASGFSCADTERSGCIGCGYEIYTKTIMHCLSKEYARLRARRKEAESAEADRCVKILKAAVMPAITEILVSIKRMYPDADTNALLDVTEMGAMLC